MSQQQVDTPETIYEALTGDEIFMDLVGTRTFKTGDVELPAISIVTPGADIPAIKKQSGLEVVIHDITQLGRNQYITNETDITTVWKIFLLAWPGANGSTISAAARRIMQLFSNATTLETNPTPSGLGSIAQLLVLVPSNSVITS